MDRIKKYLAAGLLVWLPLGVTLLIIKFLVDLLDRLLPHFVRPDALLGFHVPGVGLVLTFILVIATGMAIVNFGGRRLVSYGEYLLHRIPVVRTIYTGVKQLVETVFNGQGKSFRKVVLIEYPRKGIWTLGFITGEGVAEANRKSGRQLVNIFVPTTPNPTSGFFLMVPRDEVVELDMPVDAGVKLIISAGAVGPINDDNAPEQATTTREPETKATKALAKKDAAA